MEHSSYSGVFTVILKKCMITFQSAACLKVKHHSPMKGSITLRQMGGGILSSEKKEASMIRGILRMRQLVKDISSGPCFS